MIKKADTRLTLLVILALSYVVFLGQASHVTLRGIDSNIHAQVAMNVTAHGFLPVLPIPFRSEHGLTIFNDHPFVLFWLNGWVMRFFGPDGFSARLLTASFSVASVYLTYLLGRLLYSELYGLLAAIFLLSARDFALTSGTFSLDTALVFFILLSFYLWLKKRWFWLGLVCGVGLWVKTPLVLLVFPSAVLVQGIEEWAQQKREGFRPAINQYVQTFFLPLSGSFLLAVFIGSWVWIYTGTYGGWELVRDYWVRQLWGTAVGGRGGVAERDFGFFFYTLRTGFLLGLPFLVVAFMRVIFQKQWKQHWLHVTFVPVCLVGVIVTLMSFKLGHYFTPIFPFLALIAPYSIIQWAELRLSAVLVGVQSMSIILLVYILCTPVELAPEAFLALSHFEPYIQTYGDCQNLVVLVPGGEPVGSSHDYYLHLIFYTGRQVRVVECSHLENFLRTQTVDWLIGSRENIKSCITSSTLKKLGTHVQFGSQVLVSNLISSEKWDLTPILNTRKAVTDCHAAPYPQDRWHRY